MGETLDVRHVILPWAQPEPAREQAQAVVAHDRAQRDTFEMRVRPKQSSPRFAPRQQLRSGCSSSQPAPLPPLTPAELPFKPYPRIPDEDRRPPSHDDSYDLVSAAVGLDVLTTNTRQLPQTSELLAELTRVAMQMGESGGLEEEGLNRLVSLAQSSTGKSRETLSLRMAAASATSRSVTGIDQSSAGRQTTPRALHEALSAITTAARIVVKEATLRLEARENVEYWQA